MPIEIFTCEQNSEEWLRARIGIPTASEFATVMRTKGKGEGGTSKERTTYLYKLASEIITEEPMESYSNAHMERGKIMEEEARDLYAFMKDVEPECVGFIRNGNMGCSPDSLIGTKGGLEIKTALPHIQIDRLFRNDLPPEHKAQVHGGMLVTGREWWDFVSYWPKMPLLVVRVVRDDAYIKDMQKAIDQFNAELHEIVERLRRYGKAPNETPLLMAG